MKSYILAFIVVAAQAEMRFLSDDSGLEFDMMCNPENPDHCVKVPKQGTGRLACDPNDPNCKNPIVGTMTSKKNVLELEKLCNPKDPNECVLVPEKGSGCDPKDRDCTPILKTEEGGSLEFDVLCDSDNPDNCVYVPKKGSNVTRPCEGDDCEDVPILGDDKYHPDNHDYILCSSDDKRASCYPDWLDEHEYNIDNAIGDFFAENNATSLVSGLSAIAISAIMMHAF